MVVLDEATSALPVADERNLYKSLQDRDIGLAALDQVVSSCEPKARELGWYIDGCRD